jgi:hypothetical protein
MSEENISTEAPANDFEPIVSEEQLEKRIGARLARERAKYSDYSDLKSKAAEFDKLQEATKTEAQKVAERITQLEKELESERFNTVRSKVASEKGVPAHRISGATPEELEASADAYIAEIADITKPRPPRNTGALKSGATGSDNRMDPKEKSASMIQQIFRQGG